MTNARVHIVALGAVAAALTLSGCGGDAPAPDVASPTPAVASTSSAPSTALTPTGSPSTVVLPTDCAALGTDVTRQETVGDLTLQSNGEGFVRPAPAGATLALGCDWIVGDSTGMVLLISTAEPPAVTGALGELPADGYSCQASEDFAAQFCVLPGSDTDTDTDTDTEEMIVARDSVWIYLSTSNRSGRALLSEIVQGIFG